MLGHFMSNLKWPDTPVLVARDPHSVTPEVKTHEGVVVHDGGRVVGGAPRVGDGRRKCEPVSGLVVLHVVDVDVDVFVPVGALVLVPQTCGDKGGGSRQVKHSFTHPPYANVILMMVGAGTLELKHV